MTALCPDFGGVPSFGPMLPTLAQGEACVNGDGRKVLRSGLNRAILPPSCFTGGVVMFERLQYVCHRASRPIIVDGELSDPPWQGTPAVKLVTLVTGAEPRQATTARLLWDDDYLYVAFHCEDTDIWGLTSQRDQAIYEQEVVEIFVDADCDGHGYVEIEVNPLNAVLDLFMLLRGNRARGLWDWDSEGLRTAVIVDGDPTRRGTSDRSWSVEMAIPMADFFTAPHLPPSPGDLWHFNLYRIDRAEEGDEYQAWSPVGRVNNHTPERFGRLVFSAEEA